MLVAKLISQYLAEVIQFRVQLLMPWYTSIERLVRSPNAERLASKILWKS